MKSFFSSVFSSCLGTLLALFLLVFILSAIAGSVASFQKSSISVSPNSVLKIKLPDNIPEQSNNQQIQGFSFDQEDIIGLHDYIKNIEAAKNDNNIKGIYLEGLSTSMAYASLQLIREALLDFKSSGKFIYSYNLFLDHKSLYLASVSDEIILNTLGYVDLRGFNITVPFFKELMDKLGIKYNIYYAGEFKSATEPYRLNKMSPENRLQLSEFLDGLENNYISEVGSSLKIDAAKLKYNFDYFESYTGQKALDHKIVNKLTYEEDLLKQIKKQLSLNTSDDINFISMEDFHKAKKASRTDYSNKNKIAIVYAEGDIIDDKGKEGEIGRKYLKTLSDIRNNKDIKAVVLRINSRGGSAIMSDEFLEELRLIKAEGKPVIASLGDYAASGGYYIACHADSIYSSQYTLTGSIGVFAMIPNVNTLTDKIIGVDFDTVGTGLYSNKFSLVFPWGNEETKLMQANIDNIYDRFTKVVSEGRKLPLEKVKEIAKGRIYIGNRAIELGLVDAIGDLNQSLACAARMASLDTYRTVEYPKRKDKMERLMDIIQGNNDISVSQLIKIMQNELPNITKFYDELKYLQDNSGIQMRCLYKL